MESYISWFSSFGRDQTCAMLLAIASGNAFMDIGEQSGLGKAISVSTDLSSAAKQVFYDFGERPMWAERSYGSSEFFKFRILNVFDAYRYLILAGNSGTAIFSGRREGFALYFARLIRPLWKLRIVKQKSIPSDTAPC
jgi:nuclear pore complex protein Nup155